MKAAAVVTLQHPMGSPPGDICTSEELLNTWRTSIAASLGQVQQAKSDLAASARASAMRMSIAGSALSIASRSRVSASR
jgi:hypothetical protein